MKRLPKTWISSAHQGFVTDGIHSNTLAAYLLAAKKGADMIETDVKTHDLRIAYTSQMMHVLALAICDQEQLIPSKGFEGGSFRAATRVAALDAKLWTELFWANREALLDQTRELIGKLSEYAALLEGDDREALYARLEESAARKHAYNRLE